MPRFRITPSSVTRPGGRPGADDYWMEVRIHDTWDDWIWCHSPDGERAPLIVAALEAMYGDGRPAGGRNDNVDPATIAEVHMQDAALHGEENGDD